MRAMIFDLDGTLIDTVYAHVLAWQRSFGIDGIIVPAWEIHRGIGLSGKQLAMTLVRNLGRDITADQAELLDNRHSQILKELLPQVAPLPGAVELLRHLGQLKVPYGIATSGKRDGLEEPLKRLGITENAVVVSASDVERAKPEPDLFLLCQERLKMHPEHCFVVGDAIWDLLAAKRAGMLGVGMLTGGIGEEEFIRAGAYRIYRDPAEFDTRLHEVGLET